MEKDNSKTLCPEFKTTFSLQRLDSTAMHLCEAVLRHSGALSQMVTSVCEHAHNDNAHKLMQVMFIMSARGKVNGS